MWVKKKDVLEISCILNIGSQKNWQVVQNSHYHYKCFQLPSVVVDIHKFKNHKDLNLVQL